MTKPPPDTFRKAPETKDASFEEQPDDRLGHLVGLGDAPQGDGGRERRFRARIGQNAGDEFGTGEAGADNVHPYAFATDFQRRPMLKASTAPLLAA